MWRSWLGKTVIVALLGGLTVYATNVFTAVNYNSSGTPFDADAGTDDGLQSAFTYVSFNYTNDLYVEAYDFYSTTSDDAPYTYIDQQGPVFTDTLDGGKLWWASEYYYGASEIWFSFNNTDYYMGGYAYAYH
jgi:hypothetical protein